MPYRVVPCVSFLENDVDRGLASDVDTRMTANRQYHLYDYIWAYEKYYIWEM